MSGAVFTLGNSVSGSLSLGSALSKFGRVAGQAGFTIEQEEETLNNTVTSRYAGLAAVTVSGVTSVLNPSLVLIPSAYNTSGSTGILYSLHSKPNGVGDFVVTRATEGTRFNSVGKISTVGSGDARLDYLTSGGTAGCPALLVEPSGSNVALRSAGLDVSGTWQRSNISVTTGITSPEGLTTAFNIVESSDVTAQTHELAQSGLSVSSGTTYTFSLFIKAGTNNRNIRLVFGSVNFVGSPVATFNPVSGSVVASGDCVASVENYGNGWFRCRITATADVAGTSFFGVYLTSGTTFSYIGNGSGSVQVWGAQVEASSFATSYIPTTTAAVTRNADVITLSGAGSGCIGQTEGTIYWEGESLVSGAQDIISINQSNTNSVAITKLITNVYRCVVIASGTALTVDDTVVKTGFVKIAFAYKSGDTALFINGAQVGSTNTTVFTFSDALSSLIFGPGDYYSGRPDQKCRTVALYSTRLTNAQLAALTT
jgi:hypothetical protein